MALQATPIHAVLDRILAAADLISFPPSSKFPADIIDACESGRAVCVADPESVAVLRCDTDESGRVLFVWWAHTERRGDRLAGVRVPEVMACARALNCQKMRFCSTLPMWLRHAPTLGWTLASTAPDGDMTFEMDVT